MRNKFLFLGFAVALTITATVALPQSASAALTSDQVSAIMNLLQSFGAEQSVVNNVQTALTGGTPTPSSGSQFCNNWNTNLRIGSSGNDVAALSTALGMEGFNGGMEQKGVFGETLASAVTGFQEKYRSEILAPAGLQYGTGFVGVSTRAKLNSLYGCNTTTPIRPPSLPFVQITSPNGGEIYKNDGSSITVNWYTSNVPSSHIFDLIRLRGYPNGGEINLATNVLNDGQEVVFIPPSIPVGTYTLEMKSYLNQNYNGILVADSSDSYFTITAPTTGQLVPASIDSQNPGAGLTLASDASVSFQYNDRVKEDHAGTWNIFNADGRSDYNWQATLNLKTAKTIKSILQTTNYRGLAGFTSRSYVDGKQLYPIVVFYDGRQLNNDYDQTLGTYSAGTHVFSIFGQNNGDVFDSFGVTIYFTDGTYVSAKTDGNVTTQGVPTLSSMSPLSVLVGSATTLTLTGTNFAGGEVSFSGPVGSSNLSNTQVAPTSISSDGRTLTVAAPTTLTVGTYNVRVVNYKGSSSHIPLIVTSNQQPALSVSLNPSTPDSSSVSSGSTGVVTAVINLRATGGKVLINQISVGVTPASSANLVKNIQVFDGAILLGSVQGLTNQNVSVYQNNQWASINIPTLTINSDTDKTLTIKTDITSSVSGSFQMGVVGVAYPTSIPYQNGNNWSNVMGSQITVQSVSQPSITVLSPNGGEIIQAGNPLNISWTSRDLPQSLYGQDVYLVHDPQQGMCGVAGSDKQVAGDRSGSLILDGAFTKRLVEGNTCRFKVKVVDYSNHLIYDTSDSYFTITSPATNPEASVSITASPNPVPYNTAPTISWSSQNTTKCFSTSGNFATANAKSGTATASAQFAKTTYSISCIDTTGQSVTNSVVADVSVTPISLTSISPTSVQVGNSAVITVTGTGFSPGTQVSFSGPVGSSNLSNTQVAPTSISSDGRTMVANIPASLVAGTYNVRAVNANGSSYHQVLTVTAPPSVSAGSDLTINPTAIPVKVSINGSVSDSAYPITWRKMSGPSNVEFYDYATNAVTRNLPSTKAYFNAPGTYVLRIQMSDPNGSGAILGTDDVTVTINAVANENVAPENTTSSSGQNMTANMFDALKLINPSLYQ